MVVAEVCSTMKYPKRSQYKHAKQKKYHVRNWAEYNEGLRRRGDLTVWFDEDAIANWKAGKTGKPGGQRVYSDMEIETGLGCPDGVQARLPPNRRLLALDRLASRARYRDPGLLDVCLGARGCSARSCGFRKPQAINPST